MYAKRQWLLIALVCFAGTLVTASYFAVAASAQSVATFPLISDQSNVEHLPMSQDASSWSGPGINAVFIDPKYEHNGMPGVNGPHVSIEANGSPPSAGSPGINQYGSNNMSGSVTTGSTFSIAGEASSESQVSLLIEYTCVVAGISSPVNDWVTIDSLGLQSGGKATIVILPDWVVKLTRPNGTTALFGIPSMTATETFMFNTNSVVNVWFIGLLSLLNTPRPLVTTRLVLLTKTIDSELHSFVAPISERHTFTEFLQDLDTITKDLKVGQNVKKGFLNSLASPGKKLGLQLFSSNDDS